MTVRAHPGSEGWHTDPSGRHAQRYFDGTMWTDQVADASGGRSTSALPPPAQTVEYDTEHVRETLIGDKIRTADLTTRLNARARDGWRVVSVTPANVAGRVGPGGVSGLLVVFERPLPG